MTEEAKAPLWQRWNVWPLAAGHSPSHALTRSKGLCNTDWRGNSDCNPDHKQDIVARHEIGAEKLPLYAHRPAVMVLDRKCLIPPVTSALTLVSRTSHHLLLRRGAACAYTGLLHP
jgi:hypothetical protein